jgi:CDP-diacylglycerol--serine O-phosphatidyltransferase
MNLVKFDDVKLKSNIPNAITLLNLAAGFLAILINDPVVSPLLILLASFFDLFDGMAARLLHVRSVLGEQLDSLADLVSFGVAPAYVFYHHMMEPNGINMALIAWFPVAAAIRLAVYNTKPGQEIHFRGLPAPSAGLFLAFFVFAFTGKQGISDHPWIVQGLPVAVGILMISRMHMLSLKNWAMKSKFEWVVLTILGLGIAVLFILHQFQGIWAMVLLYVLLSVFFFLAGRHRINPS